LEAASSAVSLILGSLALVPFFFLARSMFNHRVAYLGCILMVFFPALVVISEVPLSEATYSFFLLITLLCGWLLILRRSYPHALLFGILSGACYLTRPEFLVAFAFLLLLYLIIDLKTKASRSPHTSVLLAISLAGFLLLAFPYVNFMHSQTGHWILSGKTAHNVLKEKAYEKGTDYSGQRKALAQMLDGLTPDGELKGKVLLGEQSMFSFLKTPGFLGSYLNRIWLGLRKMNLFFVPFLLFSLFYMLSWKTEKKGWKKRLFLLLSFSPMLTMPIFFAPAGRLIEPYAPVLILMSVAGMLGLARLVAKNLDERSAAGFLAGLLVVGVLSAFSVDKAGLMARNHERSFQASRTRSIEFKKLGRWAELIVPEDASVMSLSWDSFFFYCNRQVFVVPFAPWEEIVGFARANGIGYLLISLSMEASWRDDLAFLLEPLRDRSNLPQDQRLRLVETYSVPSGLRAVLYEFEF
jgi:4-amino-4-deoxy-L-arabinose transferase-like glycosyltransferase